MGFVGNSSGFAPVDNFAALPSGVNEGTMRYVTSRQSVYAYVGGVWTRTRITDPSVANSEWWVSASTGSDDNPGTELLPIQHISEVVGRIGDNDVGQITIHVMDDLVEEDLIIAGKCAADGLHRIYITAAPTVVLTTTLSAVTQWDVSSSTNVVGKITGTASLTGHAGKIFRISGGPRDGAYGVIGTLESGSAMQFAPMQFGLFTPGLVQPQVGDTIEVLTQKHLCNKLTVEPGCVVFVDGVQIGDGSTHGITTSPTGQLWLSACKLDMGVDSGNASFISIISCAVNQSARAEGYACFLELYGCYANQVTSRSNSEVDVGDSVLHGILSINTKGEGFIVWGTFAYFDALPAGYACVFLGADALFSMNSASLGGRNIDSATTGKVVVAAGGHFYYSSKPNIGGSSTDYYIGGTMKATAAIPFVNTANNSCVVVYVP